MRKLAGGSSESAKVDEFICELPERFRRRPRLRLEFDRPGFRDRGGKRAFHQNRCGDNGNHPPGRCTELTHPKRQLSLRSGVGQLGVALRAALSGGDCAISVVGLKFDAPVGVVDDVVVDAV
jgi:hypothetical protein